ncbi:AP2/ERF domain [Dillenia turbinata]|uniref:AP2/ERF domain n=1 Tax=Dillenia turbinata TaxID=194707 RepID=A0AAN8V5U3_9MAGN
MGFNDSSSVSSPHYFFDTFFTNGWGNTKSTGYITEGEKDIVVGAEDTSILSNLINPHQQINHDQQQTMPKLEDFLSYAESQTETTTQDSSLTHIFVNNIQQEELKTINHINGFEAFSGNSGGGSEVEDSSLVSSVVTPIESNGGLCLGNQRNDQKNAVVVAVDESQGSKKVVPSDTFGQRTSIYRGVTRHRWTGRYEAHLWDNSCRREGQARKGRQVYLGGYDKEEKAARAYDLAALKYWGVTATTNFPVLNYTKEHEEMKHVTKQEFIASLRRKSSGFSRGASIYRGVTRHHQQGRWQARIGRVAGNKDLYLGTFGTEEEAAEAYDIAAIKFRGVNAVTNFEMSRYDIEAIAKIALPIGGAAKRLKLTLESEQKPCLTHVQQLQCSSGSSSSINFTSLQPMSSISMPFDPTTALYHQSYFPNFQRTNITTTSDSPSSISSAAPLTMLAPPPEFYLWPHQSY